MIKFTLRSEIAQIAMELQQDCCLESESNLSHGFSPSRKSACWACCSVLCYGSGPRNS